MATCLTSAAAPRKRRPRQTASGDRGSIPKISNASDATENRFMKCSMFDPLPKRYGSVLSRT